MPGHALAATPTDYDPAAVIPSICSHCGLPIDGQFVRALNGHYHLDCFRCQDCQQVVAEKFFPLPGPDGQKHFFCEKDYFRRLDLLCAKCGGALRGAHIDALGKKYHLEHFTCTVCPTVFRQHDSYYEQEGHVYCQLHYSFLFAAKCGGCKTAVLKSFVETNKGTWTEKWHPECYMIYKLWNVTLSPSQPESVETMPAQVDKAVVQAHQAIAEKAGRILHVLSAFEESSAECISDMLIRFSHEKRQEGVAQAATFVSHIAALFSVIDDIEMKLVSVGDGTGLHHSKEPKQLTKKIVHFFSLLSYVQQENAETRQEATKEMISLVTSLAHTLKILIRAALTGALKLERDHNITTAVLDFLDRLASSEWQSTGRGQGGALDDCGTAPNPDLCAECGEPVEEECVKHEFRRWHGNCFKCAANGQDLRPIYQTATFDQHGGKCFCPEHSPEGAQKGFVRVTQLEQYIFLLKCALKRLCALLNIDIEPLCLRDLASAVSSIQDLSATRATAVSESRDPSVIASSNEALIYMDTMESMDPRRVNKDQSAPAKARNGMDRDGVRTDAVDTDSPSLLDLSGLDHWAVRQLAAQALHPLVADYFTLSELMDVACARKQSVWGRMVEVLRKPAKTKEGTFGVALEALIERYGVDTELGPRPGQLRVPILLDACIKALHGMDLSVEGIFRKNGNIRNLKLVSDEIDKDPRTIDLSGEHPVQIAALLKKFLRDMPEPLLTFKLHKLFVRTQVMTGTARRKEALHYVCCMLPKANLDFLSVLVYFLRHVAEYCEVEDHGNKMGLDNLATVITPNVLYSKSKNAADDENVLAIEAVRMILEYQDELWMLPPLISERLKNDVNFGDRPSRGAEPGGASVTRSFSVGKRAGDSIPTRNVIVTPTAAGQGGVARIETATSHSSR
ncbi:hypothetical protein DFJ77DRAFT_91248 [Powellomyces hirtus]|nr:hypothetical protein DFJ77DRAFT_91248 [Powellomyces hirtus]